MRDEDHLGELADEIIERVLRRLGRAPESGLGQRTSEGDEEQTTGVSIARYGESEKGPHYGVARWGVPRDDVGPDLVERFVERRMLAGPGGEPVGPWWMEVPVVVKAVCESHMTDGAP